MVVTNDPDWASRMHCLRVHGMDPKYYHKHLGWNARLDAVQAALLRVKLPNLERWIAARQAGLSSAWTLDLRRLLRHEAPRRNPVPQRLQLSLVSARASAGRGCSTT